jgi:hypothetical protein
MATTHYFLVLVLATVAFARNIFPASEELDRLIDPFVPGEYPINHTAYRQALNLFLDTNIDVYAPNATGSFPVFYFITGFGGIQFDKIPRCRVMSITIDIFQSILLFFSRYRSG